MQLLILFVFLAAIVLAVVTLGGAVLLHLERKPDGTYDGTITVRAPFVGRTRPIHGVTGAALGGTSKSRSVLLETRHGLIRFGHESSGFGAEERTEELKRLFAERHETITSTDGSGSILRFLVPCGLGFLLVMFAAASRPITVTCTHQPDDGYTCTRTWDRIIKRSDTVRHVVGARAEPIARVRLVQRDGGGVVHEDPNGSVTQAEQFVEQFRSAVERRRRTFSARQGAGLRDVYALAVIPLIFLIRVGLKVLLADSTRPIATRTSSSS